MLDQQVRDWNTVNVNAVLQSLGFDVIPDPEVVSQCMIDDITVSVPNDAM